MKVVRYCKMWLSTVVYFLSCFFFFFFFLINLCLVSQRISGWNVSLWSSVINLYDMSTSLWNSLYRDNTEVLKNCPKSPHCPKSSRLTVFKNFKKIEICSLNGSRALYVLLQFKFQMKIVTCSSAQFYLLPWLSTFYILYNVPHRFVGLY